jgi:hypothetical protein
MIEFIFFLCLIMVLVDRYEYEIYENNKRYQNIAE